MFRGGTHPNMVLAGLDVLRRENTFTDVRIKVEEAEFPVHKCVLSSFSPYFKAMFTTGLAETDQEVVTLNGVEPGMISGSAANRLIGEVVQSRRRPLLGPSPG